MNDNIKKIPSSFNNEATNFGLTEKELETKFGRSEDIIEAHIYDLGGNLIESFYNVKETKGVVLDLDKATPISNRQDPPGDDLNPQNSNPQNSPKPNYLFDIVELNPLGLLEDNFSFGKYRVTYNFLRPKLLLNQDLSPVEFKLKSISPSRSEIEIQNIDIESKTLEDSTKKFLEDLNSYEYFRDFVVNFGGNKLLTGLNIALNKNNPENYTLYIKLYETLPSDLKVGDSIYIEEKLTDSVTIETEYTSQFVDQVDNSTLIRPANFSLNVTKNLSVPTEYKTYNELLSTQDQSSFRRISNKLKGIKPDIDYTDFSNFVHFGSAYERLENFKYKLSLYELYNSQLSELDGSGASTSYITSNKTIIQDKLDKLIENLDDYESFLFNESSSYTWPKSNSSIPYTNVSVTSSAALTWFGSFNEQDPYFGGMIYSASLYDKLNTNNLINVIPKHIRDNSDNQQYEIFVSMIGQHFDQIWAYIDDIGEIKDAHNDAKKGINKDLVKYALKSMGIDTYKANFNESFLESILETSVSASNISDYVEDQGRDQRSINSITGVKSSIDSYNKEIWKRLYHNVPYLLKARGTERGLRALINCYGIPDTILQVKEFGGPQKTGGTPNYYIHNKFSYSLSLNKGVDYYSNITSSFNSSITHNEYESTLEGKTIEMRFRSPYKTNQIIWEKASTNEGSNYVFDDYVLEGYTLESLSGSGIFTASLEHSSSATPATLNSDASKYYEYGRIIFSASFSGSNYIASGSLTPYAPIYDGDWWNLSIRIPASGSTTIETDLYKAPNQLEKQATNIIKYTASGDFDFTSIISGSEVLETLYYNSPVTIGRGFSGSLQEYREYNDYLTEDTIRSHAESPELFNGNSYSSSFNDLYFRLALGFDLETTFISSSSDLINLSNEDNITHDLRGTIQSIHPNQSTTRYASISGSVLYTSGEETMYTRYPNSSANNLSSAKTRIEPSLFEGPPILSTEVRGEKPAYDNAPIDSHKLGVYFSPTYEMNQDMVGEMGLYNFDQFIGDPSDIDKTSYSSLETAERFYKNKKPNNLNRYKFEDYIKLIQYFDTSLFDAIEQFVPARTNLIKGLVIEPTIFDRNKIPTFYPTTEDRTINGEVSGSNIPSTEGEYILTEVGYNLTDYMDFESINPIEGNVLNKKYSSHYATVVGNSLFITQVPPESEAEPTFPPTPQA